MSENPVEPSPISKSKVHHNNSALLEPLIQKFLSRELPHGETNGITTTIDRICTLVKDFVPSGLEKELSEAARTDPSDMILQKFYEVAPYASADRHRHYSGEDYSSQHPDIQNPEALRLCIEACHIQMRSSLMKNPLIRPAVPETQTYLQLRNMQNADWAITSYNTGKGLLERKSIDKAVKAFEHALDIDPTNVSCHLELAKIAHDKKDYEKAVVHLEKGLEINPASKALYEEFRSLVLSNSRYKHNPSFRKASDIHSPPKRNSSREGGSYRREYEDDDRRPYYHRDDSYNRDERYRGNRSPSRDNYGERPYREHRGRPVYRRDYHDRDSYSPRERRNYDGPRYDSRDRYERSRSRSPRSHRSDHRSTSYGRKGSRFVDRYVPK